MKTALIVSLAIVVLPLGYLAKDYGHEFLAVDACLDLGGSYDYKKYNCDKNENHPYISYSQRKKALIMSCAALSLLGIVSIVRTKRKSKIRLQ